MSYLLAFSLGVVLLMSAPELPGLHPALLLLPAALIKIPRLRLLACLLLGLGWATIQAEALLDQRLSHELEGVDIVLSGEVVSLPQVESDRVRFLFETAPGEVVDGRIRVDWYHPEHSPAAGEQWRLKLRLKRPHGLLNPGGFDYEAWLFRQGITATGYVRRDPVNRRLSGCQSISLLCLRGGLRELITRSLGTGNGSAMLVALLIGDRSLLEQDTSALLRQLGVGHLIVISGLHVAMIAGFVYFLSQFLWRCSPTLMLWIPTRQVASGAALAGALGYSMMAGFSVSTQRALVMAVVLFGSQIVSRTLTPLRGLALALAIVLLLDPLAPLGAGFWLSFGAVSAIALVLAGDVQYRLGWLFRLPHLQLSLSLLLAPLLAALGFGIPVISPLANLVLIPLFGFALVPLAFFGLFLLLISGGAWFQPLSLLSEGISVAMDWLLALSAQWPDLVRPPPNSWLTATSWLFGSILLFLPRGLPGRLLSPVFLIIPLLQPVRNDLAFGDFRYIMLDTGQGLASVVMTREHLLVYDTGPSHGIRFDAGRLVLVPFLLRHSVQRIDRIVVSNGDNDHAGGLSSLLQQYQVRSILSGEPWRFPAEFGVEDCALGEHWEWDGVRFEIIGPGPAGQFRGNNLSCVLAISNGSRRLLLTADVEAAAEHWLVQEQGRRLACDVLTLPHHGSRSSSTPEFIRATSPTLVLGSTGYRNRWGFPDQQVVERWRKQGAQVVTTSHSGALEVTFRYSTGQFFFSSYRRQNRRFWRDSGGKSSDQPSAWVSGKAPNTVSLAASIAAP